ncbi:MAG: DUF3108 domain-containing protein [Marinifilaceae bacterium]|jgi:hypothetical protein|nr:DUF3108 domain-containing protein [Marinifilaceae bacterium]
MNIFATLLLFLNISCLFPNTNDNGIQKTEKFKYIIHYGLINGGTACLELTKTNYKSRPVYHMKATGNTVGMFNTLYSVHDVYESYFCINTAKPYLAIRDIREGSYRRYNELEFDRTKKLATSMRSGLHEICDSTFDILSAFQFARINLFNDDLKKGQIIKLKTLFADKPFVLRFKYYGKEKIRSKIGKIDCYKFVPYVQTGRLFKEENDMIIWISADERKIPIRIQFDLFLGSLRCDLVED